AWRWGRAALGPGGRLRRGRPWEWARPPPGGRAPVGPSKTPGRPSGLERATGVPLPAAPPPTITGTAIVTPERASRPDRVAGRRRGLAGWSAAGRTARREPDR